MTAPQRHHVVGSWAACLLDEIVPVVRRRTAAHRAARKAVPLLYVVREGRTWTVTAYWTDCLRESPNARDREDDDPRVPEWWHTFGMACVTEGFCRSIVGGPFDCVVTGARSAQAAQLIGATFSEFWMDNPDSVPRALAWLRTRPWEVTR
jgi:hypothetical protein